MQTLDTKIKQEQIERNQRRPLFMIQENRAEIREISERAQNYIMEIAPSMVRIKIWEMIPRVVIQFIEAALNKLDKSTTMSEGESTIILGDIMEIGIDGMETRDGDKDGNITPLIIPRSEWKYENIGLPYMDDKSIDEANILRDEGCEDLPIQFFKNREEIKEISIEAAKVLSDEYGITLDKSNANWFVIPIVVLAFFRKMRDYLVEHKDDTELGIVINFASILKAGIEKEGGLDKDDPVDYYLFISAEQYYKKEKAKDDEATRR